MALGLREAEEPPVGAQPYRSGTVAIEYINAVRRGFPTDPIGRETGLARSGCDGLKLARRLKSHGPLAVSGQPIVPVGQLQHVIDGSERCAFVGSEVDKARAIETGEAIGRAEPKEAFEIGRASSWG